MKKIELREDELKKYTTIKKLVETGGNKKKAATKLNCSLRTIDRMIARYKNQGKAGFIHGNRGKMPSTTISQETKNKIVNLYINEYLNTNYTYFCQIIKDKFGYTISDTTINRWLREKNIVSSLCSKKHQK